MKTWGIIILFWLIWLVVGTWVIGIRNRRIAKQRSGETFSNFAAYFAGRSISDEILRNTYEYFEEWNSDSVGTFPVRATDTIADIYGIIDEDLDDAIEEILKKSGRRFPTKQEILQPTRVDTVEDVVLYVAAAPTIENGGA